MPLRPLRTAALLVSLLATSGADVVSLVGGGSTLAANLYAETQNVYALLQNNVSLTYYGIGSGDGLCLMFPNVSACSNGAGLSHANFVGSDSILTAADYAQVPSLQMYPTVASAVVPIYNLPGYTNLTLPIGTLARIFMGQVTHWNDPTIVATNPSLASLARPIELVVRQDESGTSEIFKKSLHSFNPDFQIVGDPALPVWVNITPTRQYTSNGVATYVLITPYTLGYTALGNAEKSALAMAALNKDGVVITATSTSLNYAVLQQGLEFGNNGDNPDHLTADLMNAPGTSAWPISGYTYLVLNTASPGANCTKVRELMQYWDWFWTSTVATDVIQRYGFCPLPSVVRQVVVQRFVSDIQCKDGLVWDEAQPPTLTLEGPMALTDLMANMFLIFNQDFNNQFAYIQNDNVTAGTEVSSLDPESILLTSWPAPAADMADVVSLPFAARGFAIITALKVILDGPTLARILDGTITTWLDPEITALNPAGISFPNGTALIDTTQQIVIFQDPLVRAHLVPLLKTYLPSYTGSAYGAAAAPASALALIGCVTGTVGALSVTTFTRDIAAYPAGVATFRRPDGQLVVPSLVTIRACVAPAALPSPTGTYNLQAATGLPLCYPLAEALYATVARTQCAELKGGALPLGVQFVMDLYTGGALGIDLNEYGFAQLAAPDAAVLDALFCRPTLAGDGWLVATLSAVVGALLLIFGPLLVFVWRATRRMREMRRQFSNENVATQCAEAIARLDLDAVAWLQLLERPNKIQQSFIAIVNLVKEVKPFVPDQLLTKLQHPEKGLTAVRPDDSLNRSQESSGTSVSLSLPRSPSLPCIDHSDAIPGVSKGGTVFLNSAKAKRQTRSNTTAAATQSPRGEAPKTGGQRYTVKAFPRPLSRCSSNSIVPSDLLQRRCTYLVVRFGFSPIFDSTAALQATTLVAAHVTSRAKKTGATIDQVTFGYITVHWGIASAAVGAPVSATLLAMDLLLLRDALPDDLQTDFWSYVAVGHGICTTGTVSASGHRFFVIGGPAAFQPLEIAMRGLPERLQCQVLVTSAVHHEVQHSIRCRPRLWYSDTLLWQPLAVKSNQQPNEWMYELEAMANHERQILADEALERVFTMVQSGESWAAVQAEVASIKQQYRDLLSEQDLVGLHMLLSNGPTNTWHGHLAAGT